MASPNQPALESNFLTTGTEAAPGYRLCKRLGAGGFGEVWDAEGPGGFHVALKIVRLGDQAAAAELRSLDILKSIRHPNLLTTFGAWESNNWLVIAMELADRTLWDRFQEAVAQGLPGIPRDELHEYILEAAKGIDYLNAQKPAWEGEQSLGVQHRDIKPQNILLVGNGVKVADFGLARLLEHTVTGHTGGMTVAYAPPEFFHGQTSRHSDQYSLAVTYCELRGGRLPFTGSSAQVMAGHLMHPPDLMAMPADEQPVVARALAKEPNERWPNCRGFAQALHACRPAEVSAAPLPAESRQALDRFATAPSSSLPEKQRRSDAPPVGAVPGPLKKRDTATAEGSETDLPVPPIHKTGGPSGRRRTHQVLLASLALVPLAAGLFLWSSGTFRHTNPTPDLSSKTADPLPPAVAKTNLSAPLLPPAVAKTNPSTPLPPVVAEAKPVFRLIEPIAVTVKAGCKKTVAMRFQQENQAHPTTLRMENLPAGVTASTPTIPVGADHAAVELSAADHAEQCDRQIVVVARAGASEFRTHFQLILQPPPRLQLTLPGTLTLEAGKRATLLVQVGRDGYEGPVQLQFERLRKGISPLQEPTIPADTEKFPLVLAAAFSMDEIHQPIKVIACAGPLRAEAVLQLHLKPTLALMHRKKEAGYIELIHGYTEALRLNLKDAVALYNRGYVYNLRGEYHEAIADCSAAISLDSNYAAAFSSRAFAYNATNESDKALADCTQAIRLDPNSAFAYKERACAYVAKREVDKAIADCHEAIRLAPEFAFAYNNRAASYNDKGDFEKAIADCNTAIRLDPQLAYAYHNRGIAYVQKGEYDQALADCTKAIQLDPTDAMAYRYRGAAHNRKKEYGLAIADFTEAIRINPAFADAYNARGWNHYSKQEFEQAMTDYTEAIRLNPKFALAYNNRGVVYQQKKDLEKAIADFTEAIRLDSKVKYAHKNRGLAYFLKGEYDLAIADYAKAIQLDPTDAMAYRYRGAAHNRKKEYGLAIADFTEATRINPAFAEAYNARGWNHYCKGEYQEAMADYKEAIRLDPNLAVAHNNLTLVQQQIKKLQQGQK